VPAPIVDDRLWLLVEPLLPKHPRRTRYPGRKRIDDRRCLTGILYVLRTGIPWEYLPLEMGCGSGVTCWRRLREWQAAGVWTRLHQLLLDKLHAAERIDWSRVAVDSSTIRSVGAGEKKRAKSGRSQPAGKQAPRPRRWRRDPFVRLLDPRERP
jgi:transposase